LKLAVYKCNTTGKCSYCLLTTNLEDLCDTLFNILADDIKEHLQRTLGTGLPVVETGFAFLDKNIKSADGIVNAIRVTVVPNCKLGKPQQVKLVLVEPEGFYQGFCCHFDTETKAQCIVKNS
jgi:hypothetical protein